MNKSFLKTQSNNTFTTNGVRGIIPANHREFNNNLIDALYLKIGTIAIWPGPISAIDENWHLCDGTGGFDYVDGQEGTELFEALGGFSSPYGIDVASETFSLPNIQPAQSVIQQGITSFTASYTSQDDEEYTIGDILTAAVPIGGTVAVFKVISQNIGSGYIGLQIIDRGFNYEAGQKPITLTGGTGTGASIVITSAYKLNASGGEQTHTLTTNEIPAHTHVVNGNLYPETGTPYNNKIASGINGTAEATFSITSQSNVTTGLAHNNMPPYIAMNYIIKIS